MDKLSRETKRKQNMKRRNSKLPKVNRSVIMNKLR